MRNEGLSNYRRSFTSGSNRGRAGTIANGSQSWPVLGPGFKPGGRYLVPLVGSTPTGFRHAADKTAYCLSKTKMDVNVLPSPFVPVDVVVMVLPPFEITVRPVAL